MTKKGINPLDCDGEPRRFPFLCPLLCNFWHISPTARMCNCLRWSWEESYTQSKQSKESCNVHDIEHWFPKCFCCISKQVICPLVSSQHRNWCDERNNISQCDKSHCNENSNRDINLRLFRTSCCLWKEQLLQKQAHKQSNSKYLNCQQSPNPWG